MSNNNSSASNKNELAHNNSNNKPNVNETTEFQYFMKEFLGFIIRTGIIFYINTYISNKARVINSYYYNRGIFYFFILYLAIFMMDIMTYESKFINRMLYILLFCVLLSYCINYLIHKYMYKGFWLSLLISFSFSILIFLIGLLCIYYSVYSQGEDISDAVFLQFNYASFNNSSTSTFMLYFFIICGLAFWSTNYNNKIGDFLNPNVMGLMFLIIVMFIGFSFAIKIKVIDSKQILNTIITYFCLLYVIFVLQSYFLIDSIQNTCYGTGETTEKKKQGAFAEMLINLLLISIVLTLILNDIRKWSVKTYLSYILITIFVFACMFYYSTTYPSIGLLSFWNFIEWCILTSYNNHDTFNSFSFVMMNHKYNLKSKNKEGE